MCAVEENYWRVYNPESAAPRQELLGLMRLIDPRRNPKKSPRAARMGAAYGAGTASEFCMSRQASKTTVIYKVNGCRRELDLREAFIVLLLVSILVQKHSGFPGRSRRVASSTQDPMGKNTHRKPSESDGAMQGIAANYDW
ncbi:hypothetical protein K438DRAFT_1765896 [Mycena galopus ATCC 62051]|nr:hypothetical protein K438DRAFT_1765896 [Mycena galopus ATCC 62051]